MTDEPMATVEYRAEQKYKAATRAAGERHDRLLAKLLRQLADAIRDAKASYQHQREDSAHHLSREVARARAEYSRTMDEHLHEITERRAA